MEMEITQSLSWKFTQCDYQKAALCFIHACVREIWGVLLFSMWIEEKMKKKTAREKKDDINNCCSQCHGECEPRVCKSVPAHSQGHWQSAELPQLWNGRGRLWVQAEPLLVDKAEIATGLVSMGPEPHSSCTFQGVHPTDFQREKKFLCPTAPATPRGFSWVFWGMDSAMVCEKERILCSHLI